MTNGELDSAKLDFDLATTPEKRAAWAEKWARILLSDIEDAIEGDGDYSRDEYDY